jgi:pilus assembly protein CpaB
VLFSFFRRQAAEERATMRSKTVILLVLALGCGLVASIGISQILQKQDQTPSGDTAPVWVVKTDIKRTDGLTMQNLKLEQWPKEKIPAGALGKLEEIDGKRARVNLYAGEAVLDKKLLDKTELATSWTIPKDFRLYTVTADPNNSQGGLLHPDDRVDVLVFVSKTTGIATTGTKTILQDIRVFAVNDQVRTTDDKATESITAKTVTLLVTPTQAEKLALASEIGKIKLVMRGGDDTTSVPATGVTMSEMFNPEKADRDHEDMNPSPTKPKADLAALLNQASQQPAPQPAPQPVVAVQPEAVAPQITYVMQVIRGTEISETEFKQKLDDPTRWENGSSASIGNPPASTPEAEQPKPEPTKPAGKK